MPKSSIEILTPMRCNIGRISVWSWSARDERILGHLDHETPWIARGVDGLGKGSHEFRVTGLFGCNIDADARAGTEGIIDQVDRFDDFFQNQVGDFIDQPEFNRKIDECARRMKDAVVVAQPDQRLDPLDFLGPDVDFGLERAAEAPIENCSAAAPALSPSAASASRSMPEFEQERRAFGFALGAIHRDVGVLPEDVVAGGRVFRIEANSDRSRREYLGIVDEERSLEPLKHIFSTKSSTSRCPSIGLPSNIRNLSPLMRDSMSVARRSRPIRSEYSINRPSPIACP